MTMRSYVLTNVLLVNRFGYKHLLHALNVILHIHLKRTDDSCLRSNAESKMETAHVVWASALDTLP